MVVRSSGLMTFSSRSNCASARARALHLRLEFLQLLFHEGGEAGRGAVADVVGVLDVRLGDAVGDVGRQVRVRGAVADQQQVSVGRARHPQLLERQRRFLRIRRPRFVDPFDGVGFQLEQVQAVHHRAQHGIGLDQFDLRGQKLVRVVGVGAYRSPGRWRRWAPGGRCRWWWSPRTPGSGARRRRPSRSRRRRRKRGSSSGAGAGSRSNATAGPEPRQRSLSHGRRCRRQRPDGSRAVSSVANALQSLVLVHRDSSTGLRKLARLRPPCCRKARMRSSAIMPRRRPVASGTYRTSVAYSGWSGTLPLHDLVEFERDFVLLGGFSVLR